MVNPEYKLVRNTLLVERNSELGWDRTLHIILLECKSGRFQIRWVTQPPIGPTLQTMPELTDPANVITSMTDYQNTLADIKEKIHDKGTRCRIR